MPSRFFVVIVAAVLLSSSDACSAQQTAQQREMVSRLKADLARVRNEIEQARQDDAKLQGGLVKALIAVRLEILKTNEALVEQRIHSVEAGVKPKLVIIASKVDPQRAAELLQEIAAQKLKIADAQREADKYTGGLVQAMALTSLETNRNTLAILEQQYMVARYGLALPTPSPSAEAGSVSTQAPVRKSVTTPAQRRAEEPKDCLKIQEYDSSVLSSNDVYTELAWKVDVANSCAEAFNVRVKFSIYDKDEFELDTDSENTFVPANGIGKARGKMLVSPPEKARRMSKQGVSLSPH